MSRNSAVVVVRDLWGAESALDSAEHFLHHFPKVPSCRPHFVELEADDRSEPRQTGFEWMKVDQDKRHCCYLLDVHHQCLVGTCSFDAAAFAAAAAVVVAAAVVDGGLDGADDAELYSLISEKFLQ